MRFVLILLVALAGSGAQRAAAHTDSFAVYPAWTTLQSASIDFYFQDTSKLSVPAERYMVAHERAYVTLNQTFRATLPRRLRLYVWTDKELARKLLGKPLGFASPVACSCNIHPQQTRGHEMTHVLSHWAWGIPMREKTRFINEGLATSFDLTRRDYMMMAREKLTGSGYRSILDLWKNGDTVGEEVLYPAGAAFIRHLMKSISEQEFQELVKEQTIGHMRKVLGKKRFRQLVADFDKRIGLK